MYTLSARSHVNIIFVIIIITLTIIHEMKKNKQSKLN
ncbi:hypothetical protein, unlikely [Trypanosoma brucei brucei TREU927]|uniref:Uncharacterized protein n=1 Tax=Trypanosoma brucei brucei (strain 927/4 GUTat10.1) TaxID=185431 RepID=Q38G15_TRYB2|nr:hypothetical protein, unlikely [Trypanosoma brucei brucei TREU927]EAN76255.1 hypothetical protein, unlikely [Trypanosoma brucei brucei TREU927]